MFELKIYNINIHASKYVVDNDYIYEEDNDEYYQHWYIHNNNWIAIKKI